MAVSSLTSKKSGGPAERDHFGAYLSDEQTSRTLSAIASEYNWPVERIQMGGIANAVRSLTVASSPRILIVDLSDSRDPKDDINALAEVCEPGTIVIAIGQVNDVSLYRDLIASGIQDYLVKPVSPETLREAIGYAEAALQAQQGVETAGPSESRTVAVIGIRGGIGASTIATSLSWLIAHEFKTKTVLLDLDFYFGTGSLTFDLEPGRGLCDAVENPSRIDSLFIERALIKESESLYILGAEAPLTETLQPDPAAINLLMQSLSSAFRVLVADVPRNLLPPFGFIPGNATDVVVVSDLTLAATRDTIRVLAYLASVAPKARIHLAVRQGQSGATEVTLSDFEASIERKVSFHLPDDQRSAAAAAKKGQALVKAVPGSRLGETIRDMAKAILGAADAAKEEKETFWSKLLPKKE